MVLEEDGEPLATRRDCAAEDALCTLDALATRGAGGEAGACLEQKRQEARALEDVVEDSYASVRREGSTTGDAENAQLRARYAKARLKALPVEARACLVGTHAARQAAVVRTIDLRCPLPDTTALLDGSGTSPRIP